MEHVTKEQVDQLAEKEGHRRRESPIGLGFHVPMVIASPWSRGGWVNSEIFDHTSCLQFLETFLNRKTGKAIKESNISDWRRTICGDLTSVFRPYNGEKIVYPTPLDRDGTIQSIYNAKFKALPHNFKALTAQDIEAVNQKPASFKAFPQQEKGKRRSCALPYELNANGQLNSTRDGFEVGMRCGNGNGAPFNIATHRPYQNTAKNQEHMRIWNFAVKSNDELTYSWPLDQFQNGIYQLALNGPNGFFRAFEGSKSDPLITMSVLHAKNGELQIDLINTDPINTHQITIADKAYQQPSQKIILKAGQKIRRMIDLQNSHHWYDLQISVAGDDVYLRRYAGRVENGQHGFTDPLIGA